MSYPLSSTAKILFASAIDLSAGLHQVSFAAAHTGSATNLSGFVALISANQYPNELVKGPLGINPNDNIFIKRIRLNSIYRFFQNIQFGVDLDSLYSYLGIVRDVSGNPGIAINHVDLKFYEWRDVNLMLPYANTNYFTVWTSAGNLWYDMPAAYLAAKPDISDTPFIEIEFAHSLPLVLKP
jgi:hypothetical protein